MEKKNYSMPDKNNQPEKKEKNDKNNSSEK